MEGVDSNILIYAFDKSSRFHVQSLEFIQEKTQTSQLAVTEFSLFEFYGVITDGRKIGMPLAPGEAWDVIRDFYEAQSFAVLPCTSACLRKVLENAERFSVKRNDIYDFLIATTFQEHETTTVYTLNTKDFKKFDFIQAVNPFSDISQTSDPRPRTTNPGYIPYGRQSISEQDVAAVCSVLRSDFLTQGPKVPAFEQAVAEYCGAKHAVAVNSATSALHIACLALGLGPEDWLWTSPITFVASANCGLYCGAKVDFVDIDPRTYNMSVSALEAKLAQAEQTGCLPKVVVPVHMCGQPCEMQAVHALSREYGFRIIEDASHAIGGRYKGEPVGNCRYSDITVFSFHPVKIITTGEGGMALTNDQGLAEKMALLRSHGITRDPTRMTGESDGPWYYQQIDLGFNYRMTDIQAALGLSQLQRLDAFVARRRELAQRYDELLPELPVVIPWQHPDGASAWHLYVIRLRADAGPATHRQVFETMRQNGIGVNLHYIPVHTQPYYREFGFKSGDFPEAERYYQEAVSLPLFPAMAEEEQDRVVGALKRFHPTEHTEGHG
ncbi:UDP-4-amino-4,6-dideoxy-N-acetyl-beta-L-altrosamine transaminase [Desulfonatronum thiodismutans]|uniref:UDP-4-amino-4, 6-dideoxy-N-acetyl-beta-L-altrosamine transaminase n=1 Tax=Desulfonatronum thiodismutans TaxID=159290 RepID=UPI000A012AF2|nr:UDP-4-amino-4,6-dideoxy-N-acetyl-beta-L-altrosamine transaminase [Desulfonatronum thiodismutans]